MYRDVTQWTRVRRRVLTGGVSQKQIERETGISRTTVRKMIEFPIPPGYRRKRAVDRPKLGPCLELVNHIVKEDQGKPKQQQHTTRQIWEWLKEKLGFTGGLTIVTDYVREARHRAASVSQSGPSLFAVSQPSFESEDPAELTYELMQCVSKREAIRLLRVMFGGGPPQVDMERLKRLLEPFAKKETRGTRRLKARLSAFDWMRKVLQGEVSLNALARELGELSDLNELLAVVTEGRLSDRNRALAVLGRERGFSITDVCGFLHLSKASCLK